MAKQLQLARSNKAPKSDILRASRIYLRDNLAVAERALAEPERFPHLQEWARLFVERNAK